VEHLVRIAPGGAHVSPGELAAVVDSSLAFFESILLEFESLPENVVVGTEPLAPNEDKVLN
jgi:hypothetical protein